MKKLFLTLTAVTALTLASQAQTEKGKFIVGGQVGFETSKTKDTDIKQNAFSINPTVGYFVSDNWAVGTGVGYNWGKNENGITTNKTNYFQVAPFVRNYIGEGQFKFFSQLSVPMAWGKNTVESATVTNEQKFEKYGVELAPGFAFFPTSKIGIEFKVRGLYFESDKNKTNDITENKFGLDANSLSPTLGVQFHF
ncbi:outer membrane beta-barrel protein [Sphingobacterium sp. LRF_L2]|uniref:outer membrane beta-barrel protein n=1 Tax=Sphingobacterium sp. LRF_L2 TaxID=3369421 RepID=UPI003F5DD7D9